MMVKILQFGEGNFLRAFADMYFETINREYGDYEVNIVMPIPGSLERFVKQNNSYHVVLRGMDAGKAVEQVFPVSVLNSVIDPFGQRDVYYRLAMDPELKLIVSNTTEAGICFREEDTAENFMDMTFPGKLTLFLYERFRAGLDGVYMLPVELIDSNADQLKCCVEKYIDLWNLPEGFRQWNEEENYYCNTLVDRIVSGYPRDEQTRSHLETLIGEEDQLMTVGEPFGLWVIEEKGDLRGYIRPGHHNIDVVLTDDVTPYKKRKVRVLNGSHTNLVPAGLFLGQETVYDCMNDERLFAFVRSTLTEEIVPFVSDAERFAEDVLERFRNPYLNHQLTSIALNSISKWRARVLPSFRDYYAVNHKLPIHLTVGFSYLMALYASVRKEDTYYAILPNRQIQLADDRAYLDHFAGGGSIEDFIKDTQIWGEDLTAYPGFCETVTEQVNLIRNGACLL